MKTEKIKSTPLRMCVVCKEMVPKKNLLRIVVDKNGEVFIDYTGKANGRGAYVCNNPVCVKSCIKKKILNKVFKKELSEELYNSISEAYEKKCT